MKIQVETLHRKSILHINYFGGIIDFGPEFFEILKKLGAKPFRFLFVEE
jgi:hypothetical protein